MRDLPMPPARELAWFASLFHRELPRYFVHCPAFRPMTKADAASGASSQGRVQRTPRERSLSSFARPHGL
eukprot:4646301-Pyramimonas_sp.AAC.1